MNFDLATTAIERGTTLIEASAGTGKTFTIAGIYLRLIVEEGFSVEDILVVTFTEAATAELRDRIRRILSTAATAFNCGKADTPYIQELVNRHPKRQVIVERLERAIRDFDQSAIFTIHGFCQRALKEHAFESGVLFDTELITDQAQIVEETIQDFWRKRFYTDNSLLLHFALRYKASPKDFIALTKSCLNQNPTKIISRPTQENSQKTAQQLIELFQKMKRIWCREKPAITQLFADKSWAKRPLNASGVTEEHLENIAACLESDSISADALGWIGALCMSKIAESTRAKRTPPVHEFFCLCEEMQEREKNYVSALELDCINFVEEELGRRKRQQNVQFFQDLLSNLRDALRSRRGDALALSLSQKYSAALIDEFQDTDPLQYEIFNRVFATRENFLFLIGDPKQAIYGFRGADIFTYLKAASAATRRYSLPTNFRSETPLVEAVNSLFQSGKDPFIFPGIQFESVQADGKADATPLTIGGKKEAPLQFWIWDDIYNSAIKNNAEKILPEKIAAEISILLATDAKIGDRKVRPSDIAVLVLENQQAQAVQGALRHYNIPSVLHTNESLFSTHEAEEIKRLLFAIAEPVNERLLRAALSTDLIGLKAQAIDALTNNEQEWQDYLLQFREYHEDWMERGFIQMFRRLLLDQNVRQRLLTFQDGERRLTNVLHLSEVLHQSVVERQLGPGGLLKWFDDQMGSEGETAEENQLRLESDENAVQLVTVHKSKGLEYPIVFCPFSWKPAKIRTADKNLAWYHDGDEVALDLGSNELSLHQESQLRENLAEKMRLLYVAVTRARNRCYVVWGQFNAAENSALAYLLHQPSAAVDDLWKATAERFVSLGADDFAADLQKLTRGSIPAGSPTIAINGLPHGEGIKYSATDKIEAPRVQSFTGEIEANWRVTSFSSLRSGALREVLDFDSLEGPGEALPAKIEVPLFPSNIRAGICIHSILQALDFTEDTSIETVVRGKLEQSGFGEEYDPVVCAMARNALKIELPGIGTLSTVPKKHRLDEMEFYFPLNEISPMQIDDLLRKHDVAGVQSNPPNQIGRLTFNPAKGFMKGYIDTVIRSGERFYIVDWKTNWLGNNPEEYSDAGMRHVLLAHYYHLQYHIYTLALHRYLQQRLPDYDYETHFGGVYYIFLRGLDPKRPHLGLFHDKPSTGLIDEFDRMLIPAR